MKVLFFKLNNKKNISQNKFIHVTCNIILCAIVFSVLALSFFSPVVINTSANKFNAVYSGNKTKSNVSLMINVYWGQEYLDEMLEVLNKNSVKATFFVGGSWVSKNTEDFLKIDESGHEIGNHGYNHKDHSKINSETQKNEILLTEKIVNSLSGNKTNLFAPPSGSYNQTALDIAGSLGYTTIMWSKDTIDWRDKDSELVFSRATKNLANGDLILMHPTKHTASSLDRIIKTIKQSNFNLVTVSENLAV